MRLSNKVLFTVGVTWLLFVGIIYLGSENYLKQNFKDIDLELTHKNVLRVQKTLRQTLYSLGRYTSDWAHWNEAYEFVAGGNAAFVPRNFSISAFANSDINIIMYFNNKNQILVGTSIDLRNNKLTNYPQGLDKYLEPGSPLLFRNSLDKDIQGLIYLPSGVMLVASSTTSWTDLSMPSNGFLVTGRYFNEELLEKISNDTELELKLFTLNQILKDDKLKQIFEKAKANKNTYPVEFINKKISYAYKLLQDIFDKPIGMIRVTSARRVFWSGNLAIDYFLGVTLLAGFILSIILWYMLRIFVLKRLEYLNKEISKIGKMHDYSRRLKVSDNDEISSVTEQFNRMMETIEDSYNELEKRLHQISLSQNALAAANAKLTLEITERTQAEAKIATLNSQLLLAARRAGMADIATGVLHNVGNILNSLVTSVTITKEKIQTSKATQLINLTNLFKQHEDNLASFIKNPHKGQQVINYMGMLGQLWQETNQEITDEILRLEKNIGYISDVIRMQQTLSTAIAVVEETDLVICIDDAIIINKEKVEELEIQIVRDYQFDYKVYIDKVKLLHILVNIIKNAIESLSKISHERILKIRLYKLNTPNFCIEITDNGVGIAKEDLKHIFTYGFTTKQDKGHGLGLHTSVISAQEMGGKLNVVSDGPNKGATFTLIFPIQLNTER